MTVAEPVPLRSTIPARLDRLTWSPFHTRMVAGLGAAWILDELQITISSSVTGVLQSPATLGMIATQVGLIASIYLAGEMAGALLFGRMCDRLGRKAAPDHDLAGLWPPGSSPRRRRVLVDGQMRRRT